MLFMSRCFASDYLASTEGSRCSPPCAAEINKISGAGLKSYTAKRTATNSKIQIALAINKKIE